MSNKVLEAIKEGNRLARMRLGQDAPDIQPLKSRPEVRVALVPLVGKEEHKAWVAAAELDLPDNAYANEARDYIYRINVLHQALRTPSDLSVFVFPDVDTLEAELEDIDINFLMERNMLLKADSSPALDGLSDDEVADLKKVWDSIELSELSGRSWELAKQVLFETSQASLMDRSRGFSSIRSLIGMSGESESTPGASES